MHNLIVCADDFGLTQSINHGIDDCLNASVVKSTCIMPNMRHAKAVKPLINKHPTASFGLHWTLTLGKPVSENRSVSSLVDESGKFHTFIEFRRRLMKGKISFKEVKTELDNQILKLQEYIKEIVFWNTHQNIHLWPGLFQLCIDTALSAGIKKMRNNSRITLTNCRFLYNLKNYNYFFKGIILDIWSYSARKKGVVMPDGLIAMPKAGPGKVYLEESLEKFYIPKNKQTIEASLHPADEKYHSLFGKLKESRFLEYNIFTDQDLKKRLYDIGFNCIGYHDLGK